MILELGKIIASCNYMKEINTLENKITVDFITNLIETPPDSTLGDYAFPCFGLAKLYRQNPNSIAEGLKLSMEASHAPFIHKIQAIGGYLNFYLDKGYYCRSILWKTLKEDYGITKIGTGKIICMDYSSPNIAKNFHVGHLRTTMIGNSLYHIFTKLGYKVIRINHLGDWGTQFGKLIVAYKEWSNAEQVEKNGINELLRIYVLFHKESKTKTWLETEARNWFVKLEHKDEEAVSIWEWFKKISLLQFEQIYKLLGVDFDYYTGESFYIDKIADVVQELEDQNLLIESNGAKIVHLEESHLPPCLIVKSDGSSIYPSRDLAAIFIGKIIIILTNVYM